MALCLPEKVLLSNAHQELLQINKKKADHPYFAKIYTSQNHQQAYKKCLTVISHHQNAIETPSKTCCSSIGMAKIIRADDIDKKTW